MGADELLAALDRLEASRDLSEVQDIIRSTARQIVDADGATFVLRDGDRCFYVDEDAISPLWKGQRFPITECISGWAMLHDETVVIPDITEDARVPIDAYRPTFVKALAMVPIGRGTPVGAIGTYWARRHTAAPAQVEALGQLAAAAAGAIGGIGLDEAPFLPSRLGQDAAAV